MEYPALHREIVEALFTEGRFLVEGEPTFTALREAREFYETFFQASFGLQLQLRSDFALLESDRDNDTTSRDICIFLAVLCYELDREGRNILDELNFHSFEFEQVDQLLELSSFKEILEATNTLRDAQKRRNFYLMLARRQLIEKQDDNLFRFTPAHKYFLEYARDLTRQSLTAEETGE